MGHIKGPPTFTMPHVYAGYIGTLTVTHTSQILPSTIIRKASMFRNHHMITNKFENLVSSEALNKLSSCGVNYKPLLPKFFECSVNFDMPLIYAVNKYTNTITEPTIHQIIHDELPHTKM